MRAAVCRTFGAPMEIEEISIDPPGPNEVLIDVAAVAICHSDILYWQGSWGGRLPAVYGHEACGLVRATGEGVTGFEPGQFVAVTLVRSCGECRHCREGARHLCPTEMRLDREPPLRDARGDEIWQAMSSAAFAEQVLVHVSQLAPLPGDIPVESAALLACGVVTGFGAVTNTAQIPPRARVAVIGTGGVGLNCVQGAVHSAAEQVIAIDMRDDKLAAAARLGATATINATQDVAQEVADLTEGAGVDYAFVSVGSSLAVESALPLVRRGGTLVIVGLPPAGDTIELDPGKLAASGQRLLGSLMGSVNVTTDIPKLADMYLAGSLELDSLVSHTFSLDDINDAVASALSGAAIRNVIVFDR